MQLSYLQTYTKGLVEVDDVLVAVHQIVKTAPVFADIINVSINKPLKITPLRQVTLVDGSVHYVSNKILLEMIKVHSPNTLT
jgi:hypothetical protein